MEDDSGRETCGDCLEKKTLIYVVNLGTNLWLENQFSGVFKHKYIFKSCKGKVTTAKGRVLFFLRLLILVFSLVHPLVNSKVERNIRKCIYKKSPAAFLSLDQSHNAVFFIYLILILRDSPFKCRRDQTDQGSTQRRQQKCNMWLV